MDDSTSDQNSTEASTTNANRCHLLALPQELLDSICDYAYPFPGQSTIIWRKRWDRRELQRKARDSDHIIRSFPALAINHFLVSKKFFVTACQSYISHGTFDNVSLCSLPTRRYPGGVFCQWVTSLKLEFVDMNVFRRHAFPSLRNVQLSIQPHDFYDLEPEAVSRRVCRDQELRDCKTFEKITMKITSLQRFQIMPQYERKQSAADRNQFKSNLARFEHLVRPFVLSNQPMPLATDSTAPALYLGSAVQLHSAELLEHPFEYWMVTGSEAAQTFAPSTCATPATQQHRAWRQSTSLVNTPHGNESLAQPPVRTENMGAGLRSVRSLDDMDIPDSVEDVVIMFEADKDRMSRYLLKVKARMSQKAVEATVEDQSIVPDSVSHNTLTPKSSLTSTSNESVYTSVAAQVGCGTTMPFPVQYPKPPSMATGQVFKKKDSTESLVQPAHINATTRPTQAPVLRLTDEMHRNTCSLERSPATMADLLTQERQGWNDIHQLRHTFDKQVEEYESSEDSTSAISPLDIGQARYPIIELPTSQSPRITSDVPSAPAILISTRGIAVRNSPKRHEEDYRRLHIEKKGKAPKPAVSNSNDRHADTNRQNLGLLPTSTTLPDLQAATRHAAIEKREKGSKWKNSLSRLFNTKSNKGLKDRAHQ